MSAHPPILEVSHQKLHLADNGKGCEIELERDPQLRLTRASKERLTALLNEWAKMHGWEPGKTVWCAIDGRGVSLRRLSIPSTATKNLEQVLALQIESEFPVPPTDLAWGFMLLSPDEGGDSRSILVGAIKADALADLQEVADATGLQIVFTIASLARSGLCPTTTPGAFAILNIESHQSELASFQNGAPESLRVIRWGWRDADQSLQSRFKISLNEALKEFRSASTDPQRRNDLNQALLQSCTPLREQISVPALGEAVFWSGEIPAGDAIRPFLFPDSATALRFEKITVVDAPGQTAATKGIHEWEARYGAIPLLQLRSRGSHVPVSTRSPSPIKWGLVAMVLLLGLLSLRYVEPLIGRARLARRLQEVEKQKAGLPRMEQELSFLQYLQRNQPPFLETITTLAQSASPGLRLDSLSMNRRGEVSFRGTFANGQQAVDLRLKLIESGFFSSVVVEEQTPTPDRNQVIVRMSAQWKPPEERSLAMQKTTPRPKDLPPATPPVPSPASPGSATNQPTLSETTSSRPKS